MKKKEFGIIGFGNQAKAWALNLKDSGYQVTIYLRANSPSHQIAQQMSFTTSTIDKIKESYLAILTPDETHPQILEQLKNYHNKTILYAHGYSLHYDLLAEQYPQFEHILCAPKAIASELRFQYQTNGAIGGVYSLEKVKKKNTIENKRQKENKSEWILGFAKDLGLTDFYPATIADETKADLFSEQSLLCSVLPYACLNSYNKLREQGISKEVAFFETWYEVKLIADTLMQVGPQKFFNLISPNALLGSEIGKDLLFDQGYKEKLNILYTKIEDESFIEQIKTTDMEKLRESVTSFWQHQELTHTFNEMGSQIYNNVNSIDLHSKD